MPKPAIFLHIPKAAGTTVMGILRQQYGDGLHQVQSDLAARGEDDLGALSAERVAQIRLLAGHVSYGIHERVPNAGPYFTFLREPVDQALSLYHYVRGRERHPLHAEARSMSAVGFIASRTSVAGDNPQVRYMAGSMAIGTMPFDRPVEEPDFERALANMATFACVGIVENFDASIARLTETLDWSRPFYRPEQRTRRNSSPTTTEIEELGVLRRFDTMLYEAARSVEPPVRRSAVLPMKLRSRAWSIGAPAARGIRRAVGRR